MKHKKLIFFVATAIMSFGILTPLMVRAVKAGVEPDNAEYGNELVVDYNNPEERVSPVKRAVEDAKSIEIHYHNDDGKNLDREFWVWCEGVNGSAFHPDSGATKTDMKLSFSFKGKYEDFADKPSISFIVKMKDSWVGQSENIVIKYEDYAPDDKGKVTLWCIPGEGNAVEVYKTEQETKMDRFQLATFESWKKISVIATAVPQSYKLYALTTNYMRMGNFERKQKLQNYLVAEGTNPKCTKVTYNGIKTCQKFTINLKYTAHPNVQYYLEGVFPNWSDYTKTKYVSFQKLYDDDRFNQFYLYKGNDLGATYNDANSTTFKVWAPTAARVRLMIYKSGTPVDVANHYSDVEGSDDYGGYNMAFRPGGIWEVTVKGKDLKNCYYNYEVINSLGTNVATDPYAKACGVNGDRGMVVNWAETNPEGWSDVPTKWDGETGYDITSPQDLSIYETHIRDLTMHSSWTGSKMKGTYSAFVEEGTKLADGSTPTGFDHLKRLGVKAIQLEPVFDQDNNEDYGTPATTKDAATRRVNNWGYNPKNYNCVDGSYATDPYNGEARIKEFKSMVQAFANNGNNTRVIMDVVYNHVSSAPASCFNKLMPKYYFRIYQPDGTYYDGSGCGNEVRTEAPMMRKYVVDSLCFWASEYKIKGFRFDLMGLIDVGTIDAARKALYEIDPDIILYGEGWTGDGSGYSYDGEYAGSAWQVHGNQDMHDGTKQDSKSVKTQDQIDLLGCVRSSIYRYLYPVDGACFVGSFNDVGRNALRGDNNAGAKGYLSGELGDQAVQKVADMMVGYQTGYGGNPQQCVNYASCHDNFTLYDQFRLTDAFGENVVGMSIAAATAAECAILFSNGIAFIHGGEEVFRTKVITTKEDLALAKASDYAVRSDGKKISHNSYNLSDAVNAYDWNRLKNADGVDVTKNVQAIVDAVHLRNNLTRYTADQLNPEKGGKHPYLEGSDFNVWTNAGRDGDWPNWDAGAIGVYNKGYNCTFLFTSLSATYCAGGNPKASGVSILVNSNTAASISYSDGNVNMGAAMCIAYK